MRFTNDEELDDLEESLRSYLAPDHPEHLAQNKPIWPPHKMAEGFLTLLRQARTWREQLAACDRTRRKVENRNANLEELHKRLNQAIDVIEENPEDFARAVLFMQQSP